MKYTTEDLDILEDAKNQIKADEGLVLHPYKDSVGITTIGYGRNLEAKGLSESEAEYLFHNDYQEALKDAQRFCTGSWEHMNAARQGAIINMAFNLGYPRLSKFIRLRIALLSKDYSKAAFSMEGSLWYLQVGNRAKRLAKIMREGK
jgi:lysozyme